MELDLKVLLKIVNRRKWWLFTIVSLVSITTAIFSIHYIRPVYQASNKMIVNKSFDETTRSMQLDMDSVMLNIKLINTYKEIIGTPAIMDLVAQKHPEFNMTGEQLIGKVRVSSVNDTQVMTLTVRDGSYNRAVDIVNAVSLLFKEQIADIMKVQNVSISILSEAKHKDFPVPISPNISFNVIVAFLISFILTFALFTYLEYSNDTIRTAEDIEQYIGVPALATIAKLGRKDMKENSFHASHKKMGEANNVSIS